jgi:hypothetical protein
VFVLREWARASMVEEVAAVVMADMELKITTLKTSR